MESIAAVAQLGALAQDTRLSIYRLLVQRGEAGLAAGEVAQRLTLPAPTLSFHLAQLKQAGLVRCRRESRSLIYTADYGAMNALLGFLTENCCGGQSCAPQAACAPVATAPTIRKKRRA
jgi:DNA-binding transcriptional ArsR family regulator